MVRRVTLGLLIVLAALIALWIAALRLPDAAVDTKSMQPSAAAKESAYLSMPVAGVSPATLRDNWGD